MITTELPAMTISDIARLIVSDYSEKGKPVPIPAVPYVDAMESLTNIDDNYGLDSGRWIVAYALSNLSGWRGDVARAVKAELKARLAK